MTDLLEWQDFYEYIKNNGYASIDNLISKFGHTRINTLRFCNKCMRNNKDISIKRISIGTHQGVQIQGYSHDRNIYKQATT